MRHDTHAVTLGVGRQRTRPNVVPAPPEIVPPTREDDFLELVAYRRIRIRERPRPPAPGRGGASIVEVVVPPGPRPQSRDVGRCVLVAPARRRHRPPRDGRDPRVAHVLAVLVSRVEVPPRREDALDLGRGGEFGEEGALDLAGEGGGGEGRRCDGEGGDRGRAIDAVVGRCRQCRRRRRRRRRRAVAAAVVGHAQRRRRWPRGRRGENVNAATATADGDTTAANESRYWAEDARRG